MAAVHDFQLDQGSYWSRQLVWQDSSNNPVELGYYAARMQVRRSVNGEVVLELTSETDGGITLGEDGTILLEVDAETSSALPLTDGRGFVYDLELTPGGDAALTHRLIQGSFSVSLEVTKDAPESP